MSYKNINDIPAEKFKFVQQDKKIYDQKFDTKPVGYFTDAFRRFRKNKSSVAGGIVILILILFAIFVPIFSKYDISDRDGYYAYCLPRNEWFVSMGIDFWNGYSTDTVNQQKKDMLEGIPGALVEVLEEIEPENGSKRAGKSYKLKFDSYNAVGYIYKTVPLEEYEAIRAYEEENGVKVIYPLIDEDKIKATAYENNANAWYLTNEKGVAKRDKSGELQDIFLRDENDEPVEYKAVNNGSQCYVRVLYKEYYKFNNGDYASFLFGADASGYDILTRLASGARLSLILSVVVSAINLVIGTIVGALEGYYGGVFDLIFGRIKDFIWQIPTVVIFSLFQMYLANKAGPIPSLLLAFVAYGWITTSNTVRAQFYRFKGQEYVMAARTLGAKDGRLIFRHILPNGIGYIITASVLTIPNVIFSEASLTYMGIVNLQSDKITSIGTMLNNGQATLSTYPHCVFFPAMFIALLLICFNLFGNGLRDAFNPALRGADE